MNIEYGNNKQKIEFLITERTDTTTLLGIDWMKKYKPRIRRIQLAENSESEREKIFNSIPDYSITTIKDIEINIPLKPRLYPVKQEVRPIPLHLQEDVGRQSEKLIKSGHLEKVKDVDEDCFDSPVVITVKNDKSVKKAKNSRKLNDSCINMRPHMPNKEELLNQSSVEIIRRTSRQCVFALTGGKFCEYYRFEKGFYGLADIPTIIQEKNDRTLGYCIPAWLNDIFVVTRGSKKKPKFFMNRTKRLGYKIDEFGIKPNEEKWKPY